MNREDNDSASFENIKECLRALKELEEAPEGQRPSKLVTEVEMELVASKEVVKPDKVNTSKLLSQIQASQDQQKSLIDWMKEYEDLLVPEVTVEEIPEEAEEWDPRVLAPEWAQATTWTGGNWDELVPWQETIVIDEDST